MNSIYETAGGMGELGKPLYESETAGGVAELGHPLSESLDNEGYSFDENQSNLLEDVLPSEGIQTVEDLNRANVYELVDAIDKKVNLLKPNLPTKVNLSYFGKESEVWEQFRHRLEPQFLEAPSDKMQKELIAETMFEMEELRYENWTNLSLKGKMEVLNALEGKIASIEHRPAVEVRAEQMEPNLYGYQNEKGIALNEDRIIMSDQSPKLFQDVLETLIHEGRHQYQDYNVHSRQVHESTAEVDSWRENFEELGYASGEPIYFHVLGFSYTNEGLASIGSRLYHYQPVEIDARVFAADTMTEYRNKLNA